MDCFGPRLKALRILIFSWKLGALALGDFWVIVRLAWDSQGFLGTFFLGTFLLGTFLLGVSEVFGWLVDRGWRWMAEGAFSLKANRRG